MQSGKHPGPVPNTRQEITRVFQAHPDWTTADIAREAKASYTFAVKVCQELRLRRACDDIRGQIHPGDVQHLARQTAGFIDRLQELLDEGKALDEASAFGRWLTFSGVIQLCEKVQGCEPLRERCRRLVDDCNDRYRRNDTGPNLKKVQFETLNEKLERLERLITAQAA